MYAAEFEYTSPASLKAAVSLLDHHPGAKVIAGGQSLVPMMNLRLLQPTLLVDISRLPVKDPAVEGKSLVIPAGMKHHRLLRDPLVARHAPMLPEAARHIGNVRVRSLGTIGGSAAHGDPSAELPCVLTALGAEIAVFGKEGRRVIPVGDFFVTYLTTALQPTELVTEIRVPTRKPRSGQAFSEYARRANDFAVVEAAGVVELDRRGRCTRVSLVYGGVHDTPFDVGEVATEVMVGEKPSDAASAEVARRARSLARPQDDVHGTADYRSHLVETLGRRVLNTATSRASEGS